MIELKPCTKSDAERKDCPHYAKFEKGLMCQSLCMKWRIGTRFSSGDIIHACNRVYSNRVYTSEELIAFYQARKTGTLLDDICFTTVDKQIAAYKDEIDKLNTEKRGLSQKIAQMECSTFTLEKCISHLQNENRGLASLKYQNESDRNALKNCINENTKLEKVIARLQEENAEHYRTHDHNYQFVQTQDYCHKSNLKKIGNIFNIDPQKLCFLDFESKIIEIVKAYQKRIQELEKILAGKDNLIEAYKFHAYWSKPCEP